MFRYPGKLGHHHSPKGAENQVSRGNKMNTHNLFLAPQTHRHPLSCKPCSAEKTKAESVRWKRSNWPMSLVSNQSWPPLGGMQGFCVRHRAKCITRVAHVVLAPTFSETVISSLYKSKAPKFKAMASVQGSSWGTRVGGNLSKQKLNFYWSDFCNRIVCLCFLLLFLVASPPHPGMWGKRETRIVMEEGDQERAEMGRGRRRESLLLGQMLRIHSPSTRLGSVYFICNSSPWGSSVKRFLP